MSVYLNFVTHFSRSFMLDLDKEKLTKKWYHIELHIDAESSYFVLDDVLRKTFDIRSNFTLTSNLNISLGGMCKVHDLVNKFQNIKY